MRRDGVGLLVFCIYSGFWEIKIPPCSLNLNVHRLGIDDRMKNAFEALIRSVWLIFLRTQWKMSCTVSIPEEHLAVEKLEAGRWFLCLHGVCG